MGQDLAPAPLVSFLDRGAPYRGRWRIYAAGSGGGYADQGYRLLGLGR